MRISSNDAPSGLMAALLRGGLAVFVPPRAAIGNTGAPRAPAGPNVNGNGGNLASANGNPARAVAGGGKGAGITKSNRAAGGGRINRGSAARAAPIASVMGLWNSTT